MWGKTKVQDCCLKRKWPTVFYYIKTQQVINADFNMTSLLIYLILKLWITFFFIPWFLFICRGENNLIIHRYGNNLWHQSQFSLKFQWFFISLCCVFLLKCRWHCYVNLSCKPESLWFICSKRIYFTHPVDLWGFGFFFLRGYYQ